jgi:hypothetical protein
MHDLGAAVIGAQLSALRTLENGARLEQTPPAGTA